VLGAVTQPYSLSPAALFDKIVDGVARRGGLLSEGEQKARPPCFSFKWKQSLKYKARIIQ